MKLSTVFTALLIAAACLLSPIAAQDEPVQTTPVQTQPAPTTPEPTTSEPTTPEPTTPEPTEPAPTPAPTMEPVCYIGCPPGQYCENGTNFCRPPQQANECFNPATGHYQLGCAPGFVCANNKCSYA